MIEKVLVTGGSGFLGSALVKRLVTLGYNVMVFDDESRGSKNRLMGLEKKIDLVEGDIRDLQLLKKAMSGCKAVFHLAFVNGTKFFYEQPELVLDVGVRGALTSIEASRQCGVESYILASSSEIYQQPENVPTSELERAIIPDVLNPRFSYAGGKLISELLSINYFRNNKIRDLIFRPHNVFGPDMGLEHVVPEILKKIYFSSDGWKKNDISIEIQGSGNETRAFCFVEDAVDQIITIYERGKKGEIYHVGMNNEITIRNLVDQIANILQFTIGIKTSSLKSGGTTRRCPDISKVQSLGYDVNDNFSKGLAETVQWYKEFLDARQAW